MKTIITLITAFVLVLGLTTPASAFYNYGCCNYGFNQGFGFNNAAYYNPYDRFQYGGYHYNPALMYGQPYYGTGSVWGDLAFGVTGALLQTAYTGGYNNFNPGLGYAAPGFYPAFVCGPYGC